MQNSSPWMNLSNAMSKVEQLKSFEENDFPMGSILVSSLNHAQKLT